MRTDRWILAAALSLGLTGYASAQTPPPPVQAPPPTPGGVPATPPPAPLPDDAPRPSPGTSSSVSLGHTRNHWLASGFAGSNFDTNGNNASPDFGGQVGYLWNGIIGAEVIGSVSPSFKLNNALVSGDPNVNSYMANAIGAVPLGADGQFQPYVSGGFGAMQMRADVFTLAISGVDGTASSNQSRFAGNIGGGFMAFAGNIGVRGDVRFFHAFEDNRFTTDATSPEDVFTKNLLSGLDIWRANIGVAVRW